jgi:hypothetical protein
MFQPLTVSILIQPLDLKLQDATGQSLVLRAQIAGGEPHCPNCTLIRRIMRSITDSGTEPGAGG